MPDLILRPSGVEKAPWALQLRYHESVGETVYATVARVTEEIAKEIVSAGGAYWLFGEPGITVFRGVSGPGDSRERE